MKKERKEERKTVKVDCERKKKEENFQKSDVKKGERKEEKAGKRKKEKKK